MAELGINDFEIVLLEQQTNGQAETVVKGVKIAREILVTF